MNHHCAAASLHYQRRGPFILLHTTQRRRNESAPIRKIPGPVKICYDCDHELYPNGKVIFDDPLAKQDRKGRWHCSDCQETERRKTLLKIYGPNHIDTRYFLEHEDKEIRAWNQTAMKFGVGPIRQFTDVHIMIVIVNSSDPEKISL
jgi:hypothetical protein